MPDAPASSTVNTAVSALALCLGVGVCISIKIDDIVTAKVERRFVLEQTAQFTANSAAVECAKAGSRAIALIITLFTSTEHFHSVEPTALVSRCEHFQDFIN